MVTDETTVPYQWSNERQYFITIAANLIAMTQGTAFGWVSPAIPKLASYDSPLLTGPLTYDEISWVGAMSSAGAFIGAFFFGYIIALWGSKRVVLLLSIPYIISWVLIYFGDTYYYILVSRLMSGVSGGGVQTSITLYISEIANDSIRGRLGSCMVFTRNFGVLIGYIVGTNLQYQYVPLVNVFIPIIFAVIFIMIPNTPRFYLQKAKIDKAEKALKFYKNYKGLNQQEDEAFFKEFERLKAISCQKKTEEKFQIADYCNLSAIKGLGIGMALVTFGSLTATFAITNYAVTTFEKVGTKIDPYTSSIFLGVVLTMGSLISAYLADKLGRKQLNLISTMGSALGLLTTALFYYLNLAGYNLSAYTLVPVVSICFSVFMASSGIMPIVFTCSVENLPPKIRTFGITIICFWDNVMTFICVKMYPILMWSVDLHGCFLIYGVGCLCGFFFILFILKETSGESLDDVGVNENTKDENARKVKFSTHL